MEHGRLFLYINECDSLNFQYVLEEENFQGIDNNTEYYPTFVDIDADGDQDFFLGYGSLYNVYDGEMSYYKNTGTLDSMALTLIEEEFMNIDLGDECIPSFIDIDFDDDYDMFLGDEDGRIHFYRNDGSPEVFDFTFVTDEYANVNVANIASPTFTDIDGDGDFDLFVGERSWGEDNRRGDINFYENVGSPSSAVFELVTQNFLSVDIGAVAPPAFADIDGDSLLDMFIGDVDGNINYFPNTGSEHNPYFTFVTETFEGIAANYQSRPTFGDLDGDGDLDMIAGRVSFNTGSLHLYRNDGTPEIPDYTLVTSNFMDIDYQNPAPELVDIDTDGDLDLMVGHFWGQVVYWKNAGTPYNPDFVEENDNFLNTLYELDFCFVTFGDLDGDNDYDLIRGHYEQTLDFYRNIGTPESPEMDLEEEEFLGIHMTLNPEPFLADIDTDGDLDLFVSDYSGGVSFWRNNEINVVSGKPVVQPYTFTLLPNYPNPFNAQTVIPFTLDRAGKVKIDIFDITGRSVGAKGLSPLQARYSAGMHEIIWNTEGVASGVYLVRMSVDGSRFPVSGSRTAVEKVVLVK